MVIIMFIGIAAASNEPSVLAYYVKVYLIRFGAFPEVTIKDEPEQGCCLWKFAR